MNANLATPAQIAAVIADQRENDVADLTDHEVLAHVVNTVDPADLTGNSDLTNAYRAVLATK